MSGSPDSGPALENWALVTAPPDTSEAAARAIVATCYMQLLGHPPDDSALRVYTDSLRDDAVTAFPLMLGHLNASATAERTRDIATFRKIARLCLRERGTNVRAAVSLGVNRYTAWLLSVAGLELQSYPFDTIATSPRMIAHCLSDDFATLLTRAHYEPIPLERRLDGPEVNLCDHSWYRENFGIEHVFNFSDPTQPDEYAALERSVAAFRETANDAPATYVVVSPDTAYWQNGFAQVSRALRAYAPFTRLLYAVVREPGTELVPKHTVVSEDESHVLVEFRSSSNWSSSGFENPLDDVVLLSLILERL